jgi:hypothetical protein
MDKSVFSNKLNGNCSNCGVSLEKGGFLVIDEKKGVIEKCLCGLCKDVVESTNTKKITLVVKKLNSFFFKTTYEVISSKNILLDSQIISEEDMKKFLMNPEINIQIKY